jgi:5-methyltetrahydropteroyltriglutamate--homocysteine methyltransferase
MPTPAIRTTVVGSYPIPDWLVALPSQQSLIDATRVVFKTQEMAGIDVVADGELYRFDVNHPDTNGMIEYFTRPMAGIRSHITRADIANFSKQEGMGFRAEPAGVVEGPIDEGTLNLPRDYRRARALTNHPLKFTLTGPHMLCKTLMDHHYDDREDLAMAIAHALAKQVADLDPEVLQIDEANITGHPHEAPWAADAINVVLDAVATNARQTGLPTSVGHAPSSLSTQDSALRTEKAVHLCFGNYGGQSIQHGTWAKLTDFLNRLHADHVVLEFAFRGYAELEHFKALRPDLAIGLGVIDVKTNTVESPDTVAARIDDAARILGADRIKWVHPDCGFWMNKRSIADRKMESLVKGRDLYLGRK